MIRMANGKFFGALRDSLKKIARVENIRQGQCDFDARPAVVGFQHNGEVFLCCTVCKNSVEKSGRKG